MGGDLTVGASAEGRERDVAEGTRVTSTTRVWASRGPDLLSGSKACRCYWASLHSFSSFSNKWNKTLKKENKWNKNEFSE